MSLPRKPVTWVVLLFLAWLTFITVQIALGMGAAPDGGGPRGR